MIEKRRHEMGPGGFCICPICETRLPHREGLRCQDQLCPNCDGKMLREGSQHHKEWLENQQRKP